MRHLIGCHVVGVGNPVFLWIIWAMNPLASSSHSCFSPLMSWQAGEVIYDKSSGGKSWHLTSSKSGPSGGSDGEHSRWRDRRLHHLLTLRIYGTAFHTVSFANPSHPPVLFTVLFIQHNTTTSLWFIFIGEVTLTSPFPFTTGKGAWQAFWAWYYEYRQRRTMLVKRRLR